MHEDTGGRVWGVRSRVRSPDNCRFQLPTSQSSHPCASLPQSPRVAISRYLLFSTLVTSCNLYICRSEEFSVPYDRLRPQPCRQTVS